MEKFLLQIKNFTNLSKQESLELIKLAKKKSYNKGETILRVSQSNRNLYFIDDGYLKISFFKEDKEFVMKFFCPSEFCAVLDSLDSDKSSDYTIVALTDVNLIEIDFTKLNQLATQFHSIEKLISNISSMATKKMMSRIKELLETDAKERYLNFLENNGALLNTVSLKDLSAYLGISQVSLSRIRANV